MIKTRYREMGVPYAEETIREAVSLLKEEAAIEGDGSCKAIWKSGGVTGCVVTPLTMGTAPLLFALALGGTSHPLFVSETRNLYIHRLNILPTEDGLRFDLVQFRGNERRLFGGCAVTGFELRIHRGETGQQAAIHLKLDICGERPPVSINNEQGTMSNEGGGERFSGDSVIYRINGTEYTNIYGLTLSVKKDGGTRTELRIKRSVEHGGDITGVIEELTITARLLRDTYEYRHCGMFRITLTRLILVSDETTVDCADAVIGPVRYYAAGSVFAEVFTADEGVLV
jgi:hypothetical protein